MKKLIAIIMILLMTIEPSFAISNDYKLKEKYPTQEQKVNLSDFAKQKNYSEFLQENNGLLSLNVDSIAVLAKDYIAFNGKTPSIENDELILNDATTKLEWKVNSLIEGLYELNIFYRYLDKNILSNEIDIKINNESQYAELSNVLLSRDFKGEPTKTYNEFGDEIRSGLIQTDKILNTKVRDNKGSVSQPLLIKLNKGVNTISFNWILGEIAFSKIEFLPKSNTINYEKYKDIFENIENIENLENTNTITFQAEDYNHIKSISDSAISLSSSNDPSVSPSSVKNRIFNAIGGYSYRKPNQKIEYKFNTPESGLYKIAFRVLQNFNIGLSSYRRIEIDGDVPFEELSAYAFPYSKYWKYEVLKKDDKQDFLIYLEKGDHTLSLTAVLGNQAIAKQKMEEAYSAISKIQRKIRLITGNTPDINYDYELNIKIPDFNDLFNEAIDVLDKSFAELKNASKKNTIISNNVSLTKNILSDMKKKPDYIIQKLVDLESSLIAFSENISILEEQPLYLDEITIYGKDEKIKEKSVGFFENISFLFTSFINSFFKKEEKGITAKKQLKVWLSRGKEWGEILTEITEADFSKKYDTRVKLNILPSGTLSGLGVNPLLLAINAGNAPDVVLSIPIDIPGEYAIRNAVYPLSSFKDFETVKGRFLGSSLKPFTYKGNVYALPETIGFKAIFYRKDILKELNLSVPSEWSDIYNTTIPTLYQNNMQIYIPPVFDMFLYQNNGGLYSADGKTSALDNKAAFSAFDSLTNLYKGLGVPVSLNFYNRFRTGEAPIGIDGFGLYMQLTASAPEIKGKWDIAPIPGTRKADGTISRATGGAVGEADIMISTASDKELSWEYLKWWSSREIQGEFAAAVEGRIGTTARWNSANVDAFLELPWRPNERKVLREMMPFYQDPEIVIGGYYTARHTNNAFLRVLTENMSTRDSLEAAVIKINAEMKRKREVMKVD